MKCNKCNSEWQPPKTMQVMFCPFCRSSLLDVQETFNALEDVLFYLTKEFGIDILRNKQNTLQFVETYLIDGTREHNFLGMVYAAGFIDTIFRIKNSPDAIQKTAVKQLIVQLSDKYGVSNDWADYVINCICKSIGINNDVENSIIAIKRLAENGDVRSQYELAECYRIGKNAERDPQKYLMWLERSAKNGYPIAMFRLGEELWAGIVCEKNTSVAIKFFQDAATNGSWDAVTTIAGNDEIYSCCDIDIENLVKDLLNHKKELTATQLVKLSQYFSRVKNTDIALELARLAYEKDSKVAWEQYVSVLKDDESRLSQSLVLKVMREVAIDGNISACNELGKIYEAQASGENDMQTALYWFRMAAELGDVDTQLHIAQVYELGKNVPIDKEKAVFWYRIAAYNGSAFAKSKVSYTSKDCIAKTLTLLFEDDSELVCTVEKAVFYNGNSYLLLVDPESKERFIVLYTENNTPEGFEVEGVDDITENHVLKLAGVKR